MGKAQFKRLPRCMKLKTQKSATSMESESKIYWKTLCPILTSEPDSNYLVHFKINPNYSDCFEILSFGPSIL